MLRLTVVFLSAGAVNGAKDSAAVWPGRGSKSRGCRAESEASADGPLTHHPDGQSGAKSSAHLRRVMLL